MISPIIGPDKDIPAPDVGTNAEVTVSYTHLIKNRFEIRLKSGKAEQTIEQIVFSRNPEQTIASLILTQIDFPVYILHKKGRIRHVDLFL